MSPKFKENHKKLIISLEENKQLMTEEKYSTIEGIWGEYGALYPDYNNKDSRYHVDPDARYQYHGYI